MLLGLKTCPVGETIKLSYSATNVFKECSEKYRLHYLERIREDGTSSALVFGGAVDLGLNQVLLNKPDYFEIFFNKLSFVDINGTIVSSALTNKIRYSNTDLDLAVLTDEDIEYLKQTFDVEDMVEHIKTLQKIPVLPLKHRNLINLASLRSLMRKGELILEAYKKQVMPLIAEVLEVQKAVILDNGSGDQFIGFVDLVVRLKDGRIVIFDNKTTTAKYDKDSVKESEQLATYKEALRAKYPTALQGYIVISKVIRKKKEPRVVIDVIVGEIEEKFVDKVFNKYDEVAQSIKEKRFEKNFSACINKYKQKCPYYDLCHNGDMHGLVKLGERTEERSAESGTSREGDSKKEGHS